MTLAPTATGVTARFELDQPTNAVTFVADPTLVRPAWKLVTPGLSFADGRISGEIAFDRFELALTPDPSEIDRTYLSVIRMDQGFAVYGPALSLSEGATSLEFEVPEGFVALAPTDPTQGYSYLGPATAVTLVGGANFVAGANVPPWLGERIRASLTATLPFYTAQLGTPPLTPLVLVSVDSPGPTAFRGDVSGGGVVSLRFHGEKWAKADPEAGRSVDRFVAHEGFHLWNGQGYRPLDGETAPWLHEGAAEYASMLAYLAVSGGEDNEAAMRLKLGSHLRKCLKATKGRSLPVAGEAIQKGGAVYDCGVVLQWVADLEERSRSGKQRSVLSLWRDVFAATKNGYGVADFQAAAKNPAWNELLSTNATVDPWKELLATLTALGVELVNRPEPGDYRGALLHHLLSQHCEPGQATGFFTEHDHVRLDTGARCGPLSGDPELVAVEGYPFLSDARGGFEAAQRVCASNGQLSLQKRDGSPSLWVPCTKVLVIPKVWSVNDAPRLALPVSSTPR